MNDVYKHFGKTVNRSRQGGSSNHQSAMLLGRSIGKHYSPDSFLVNYLTADMVRRAPDLIPTVIEGVIISASKRPAESDMSVSAIYAAHKAKRERLVH